VVLTSWVGSWDRNRGRWHTCLFPPNTIQTLHASVRPHFRLPGQHPALALQATTTNQLKSCPSRFACPRLRCPACCILSVVIQAWTQVLKPTRYACCVWMRVRWSFPTHHTLANSDSRPYERDPCCDVHLTLSSRRTELVGLGSGPRVMVHVHWFHTARVRTSRID
jgi:hypothetical protein